jgi:hypothetical protein
MRLLPLVALGLFAGCTRPNASYREATFVGGDLATPPTSDSDGAASEGPRDLGPRDLSVRSDLAPSPSDLGHRPADLGPVSCEVEGVEGTCVNVADCDGTATPGHCPGPADVQCCTGQPTAPVQ